MRRRFKLFCVLCVFFCFSGGLAQAKSAAKKRPVSSKKITASGVYVADLSTNKVVLSKNATTRFYPASTVKLLTALVVLEHFPLEGNVVASRRAAAVAPTKAGLASGVSYSARDLLRVLLATSANDAGVALAEAVCGSETEFADLMNQKARRLGAKNSHFTNATGLPDTRQVTTAQDLSLIARAAFSNSFIVSVMKEKRITISGSNGKKIVRANHNKLLWRLTQPKVYGKTGYTRLAGHCYAGVSYGGKRNLVFVILKSRNPWGDIYKILGVRQKKKGRG